MKIFATLDVRANHFLKLFPDTSTANALRGFSMAANEKGSPFNHFPDDFCLMELGTFDVNTGKIEVYTAPLNLATARSVLKADSPTGAPMPMSNAPRAV